MQKASRFLVEALVVGLAAFAIFAIPLGKRTLAGHAQAVFTTPIAKDAADQVARSVKKIVAGRPKQREAP